jgi:hypothetical protein
VWANFVRGFLCVGLRRNFACVFVKVCVWLSFDCPVPVLLVRYLGGVTE